MNAKVRNDPTNKDFKLKKNNYTPEKLKELILLKIKSIMDKLAKERRYIDGPNKVLNL